MSVLEDQNARLRRKLARAASDAVDADTSNTTADGDRADTDDIGDDSGGGGGDDDDDNGQTARGVTPVDTSRRSSRGTPGSTLQSSTARAGDSNSVSDRPAPRSQQHQRHEYEDQQLPLPPPRSQQQQQQQQQQQAHPVLSSANGVGPRLSPSPSVFSNRHVCVSMCVRALAVVCIGAMHGHAPYHQCVSFASDAAAAHARAHDFVAFARVMPGITDPVMPHPVNAPPRVCARVLSCDCRSDSPLDPELPEMSVSDADNSSLPPTLPRSMVQIK
jgi:hypothetical protein